MVRTIKIDDWESVDHTGVHIHQHDCFIQIDHAKHDIFVGVINGCVYVQRCLGVETERDKAVIAKDRYMDGA